MTVSRVRYQERQVLEADDLNDEQGYRLAMRRRHNIAHHGWGIVTGLELTQVNNVVQLSPGMAVDGYGRELIVPGRVTLPADLHTTLGSEFVYVWLVYGRSPITPPQKGRWVSGGEKHTRWREEALLRLTSEMRGTPRRPTAVAVADVEGFEPSGAPPDDPTVAWPVYLGKLTRNQEPEHDNRPYATLVGEMVTAPSGRARMQVGHEVGNDKRAFGVSLPDADGVWQDRFTISQQGNATFYGPTTIHNSQNAVLAHSKALLRSQDIVNAEMILAELTTPSHKVTEHLFLKLARFQAGDFVNTQQLISEMAKHDDWLVKPLQKDDFNEDMGLVERIRKHEDEQTLTITRTVLQRLALELNLLLSCGESLYTGVASLFENDTRRSITKDLQERYDEQVDQDEALLIRLNRLLLEDAFDLIKKQYLLAYQPDEADINELKELLVVELNRLMTTDYIFEENAFEGWSLSSRTERALRDTDSGAELIQLNRFLLQDIFPEALAPYEAETLAAQAVGLTEPIKLPETAVPWHLYRTTVGSEENEVDQLRVEIMNPGQEGDPTRHKFTIGHYDNEAFISCLTVRADCTVIVRGDVHLSENSQLTEGPVQADLSDPRFMNALLGNWMGGLSSAAVQVDAYYGDAIDITLQLDGPGPTEGQTLNYAYTVTVRNSGQAALTNISVSVVWNTAEITGESTTIPVSDLAPASAAQSITNQINIPAEAGGELVVTATVIATVPDGNQIQKTAQKTAPIESGGSSGGNGGVF